MHEIAVFCEQAAGKLGTGAQVASLPHLYYTRPGKVILYSSPLPTLDSNIAQEYSDFTAGCKMMTKANGHAVPN